jgi:hypothetical protein
MSFEHAVRTAVHDLADEGRPVNVAAGALRRGRQLRRRRTVAKAAAVVAAVAALAVPYLVARATTASGPGFRPATPPSALPTPSASAMPGPVTLAEGWILGSVPAPEGKGVWVYDRTARMYRFLPYRFAAPAPTGNLVAVWDRGRMGVVDLAADTVRWLDRDDAHGMLQPQPWNADGSRFVFNTGDDPTMDGTTRVVVVDAATMEAHPVQGKVQCSEGCFQTWLPDGRVGMDAPGSKPEGVRTYRADDGRSAGTVRLPGWVGQGSPWSPDGSRVVLLMPDASTRGPLPRAVVEVATGRTLAAIRERGNVYWIAADRMLIVTSGGVALVGVDGSRLATYPVPKEFTVGEMEWREATVIRA